MSGIRTIGEAYFDVVLKDVHDLIRRIEYLPAIVDESEKKLSRQAAILAEAGNRYGQAVSGFTEEAKTELSVFLEGRTRDTIDEQVATIQQLVLSALEAESGRTLSPYREIIRKTRAGWIAAHGVTALCASVLTALLMRLTG